MLKRLLRRIGALLAVPSLAAAAPAQQQAAAAPAHPALWQVSDADTTIYLFGTIHVLPENYQWRTAASSELVVETMIDQQHLETLIAVERHLGFSPGLPPIASRVPPSKVAQLRATIAKTGIPEQVYDQMETWLAAIQLLGVQLNEMGLNVTQGPEETLRQQFIASRRALGELETNAEQFGYFDRMSEKAQRTLLLGSIEPTGDARKEFAPMLAAWSRGDVTRIARTFNHDMSESPEIKHALITERNAHWAAWIRDRLAQPGSLMIAVGAGHLAGQDSVVDLLKREGLHVRRIQ